MSDPRKYLDVERTVVNPRTPKVNPTPTTQRQRSRKGRREHCFCDPTIFGINTPSNMREEVSNGSQG